MYIYILSTPLVLLLSLFLSFLLLKLTHTHTHAHNTTFNPIASTKTNPESTWYIYIYINLQTTNKIQLDLNERRSRRDMSPQGRKRVAGMVARDYRTVSGIGQSYHNQVCTLAKLTHPSKICTRFSTHSVQTSTTSRWTQSVYNWKHMRSSVKIEEKPQQCTLCNFYNIKLHLIYKEIGNPERPVKISQPVDDSFKYLLHLIVSSSHVPLLYVS